MSDWRPAKSLLVLRDQVNAFYKERDKSSDGMIGDAAHQATHSEHNPDDNGVVRAIDITNDPAHRLFSRNLAEALLASRDPRILYVISNAQIASSQVAPKWEWRRYDGINAHRAHMHLSVVSDPKLYDSTEPWSAVDILTHGAPAPVPTPPPPLVKSQFNDVIDDLLQHEGGNDDDPQDPGGRTSRGIIQSEWNEWRKTHPGLPSDVWNAPQDQVVMIYRQKYWDPLRCDQLPPGVNYAVFDFGVNSGISRSAKYLQRLVGTTQDGQIGPITLAAAAKQDPATLVNALSDARLSYLQNLGIWDRFGRGWSTRVVDVRKLSLRMASSHGTAQT